jgi:hypothetical protein
MIYMRQILETETNWLIWSRSPRGKQIEKYKVWKVSFGIQDARKDTQSKKADQNWKVNPYLSWMHTIF